ncbi:hypothetical protein MML48_3g00005337 [Holotrichia oblita]|uniref:Uncharacterized protein n=1 Tax=Holotrichia oblita TaxID=644536 RepID=A0ACB9TI55_HOLOL|nr:hypothetical protein MML48_3g00005337 [Holotrichia oblita]
MTTSRIVRGTKGRIFVYVCAILIITGIIACYNNTRVELDNVQKSNDLCHQQQENLSTQLQVISDYKQRLEKSLKTEKTEHQQAKAELESRVNEEKLKHHKATEDATLKFNSLQQHYNLLQTSYEDVKRECSQKQNEQLNIINNLQLKLKEVQGQLQQCEREKENSLEHLKSQIEQLKMEKGNLENQVIEISKREDTQKENPSISIKQQNPENQDTLQAPNISDTGSPKPSYAKQISVKDGEYKISSNNVADLPPNNADEQNHANQVGENAVKDSLAQVVLPPPQKAQQSSTPNSRLKSSRASLEQAPPLKVPTLTPETPQNKTSQKSNISNNPDPIPSPSKKLPKGVVAVQNLPVEENEVDANLVNNRYRNVAEDVNDKEKSVGGDKIVMDAQDKENGANEIFDVGGFNDDPNIGGKQDEQKNRIDVDYDHDHFQQNDPNIDENEDDDTDYGNHNLLKEVAIRN